MLGTRAKKLRTKSYHAFSSIGYPEVARIRDRKVYPVLPMPEGLGRPAANLELDPSVFVLKLIPGIRPDVLRLLCLAYHALIVEGFGGGRRALLRHGGFCPGGGRLDGGRQGGHHDHPGDLRGQRHERLPGGPPDQADLRRHRGLRHDAGGGGDQDDASAAPVPGPGGFPHPVPHARWPATFCCRQRSKPLPRRKSP